MLYTGNKSYQNLVLIGKNIPLGDGNTLILDSLYLSPDGHIAFVVRDSFNQELPHEFLKRMTKCSDAVRSLNWHTLNKISADYYYESEGQAYDVIDLMVRYGYLSFSDAGVLSVDTERGLKTEPHLVVVQTDWPKDCKNIFSNDDYVGSSLYFACVSASSNFTNQ